MSSRPSPVAALRGGLEAGALEVVVLRQIRRERALHQLQPRARAPGQRPLLVEGQLRLEHVRLADDVGVGAALPPLRRGRSAKVYLVNLELGLVASRPRQVSFGGRLVYCGIGN